MSTPFNQKLFDLAKKAMNNAHAPYSKYLVGASILSTTGEYYYGCNVENAAYPQGLCAEASAIASMVSNADYVISQIYVIGKSSTSVAGPCGGCRQKILEFADINTIISICNMDGIVKSYHISDLLPDAFGPANLS